MGFVVVIVICIILLCIWYALKMCGLKGFICFGKFGATISLSTFPSLFSLFSNSEMPITLMLVEFILFHRSLIFFFHSIFLSALVGSSLLAHFEFTNLLLHFVWSTVKPIQTD